MSREKILLLSIVCKVLLKISSNKLIAECTLHEIQRIGTMNITAILIRMCNTKYVCKLFKLTRKFYFIRMHKKTA